MPATAAKPARRTAKLSRVSKPDHLDLRDWQIELRRQFGSEQPFDVKNLGSDPVFSEFAVTNPASRRTYRVVIRGQQPGVNFCACPDYSVNTLGTCKHIEHVLHRLRKRYAGRLKLSYTPPAAEVYVRYGAQRGVQFSPGTACPDDVRRLAGQYFDDEGALRPQAFDRFDRFVKDVREAGHELRIYDDALALIAEWRDARVRCEELDRLYSGRHADAAWRKLLKVELFPYQRDGALFAAKAGRCILADDMGLGKTIQAIAAAEILARHCAAESVLVVCPASLKYQWKSEIEQFSSRPPLVIEGLTHDRRRLYQAPGAFFKIVNYDVIHRDLEAIAAWRPDLVILDEAQRIKNWETRTAKTVKQIESRFAIVLTGTPLENRLEELHSIVEFVDRHRLGPLFAFKAAHAEYEPDTTKVIGYRDLNQISQTLAPILIRRTKDQVLKQLPARMDKNFFVPMTEEQWVPHDENKDTVARVVAKWRRYKFLTEADQLRMRIALQNMRMSCDSTYLVDHETKHGLKVDELCKLLGEIFERPDAKVVIFSQWVRMNELVIEMLQDRRWGHVHLHGGVPSKDRKDLMRTLREEPDCRVFLSTDAGGVGLNLQSASTVINMDLPWNPAVLEQRIARVHRLGQSRPVRVVNFIAEGTIEHGMLSLLAFKRSVFAGVLDGAADQVFMGESALNRFMKTVETATASAPAVRPTGEEAGWDVADDDAGPDVAAPATPQRLAPADAPPLGTPHAAGSGPARAGLTLDVNALGDALARGAQLLQALGARLTQPHSGNGGSDVVNRIGPRIETNAQTGRRELRIDLPEEQVLQQWIGQLSNLIRNMTRA